MKTILTLCAALVLIAVLAPGASAQDGNVYRHLVAFEFKKSATEHHYMEVIGDFMALKDQIDGIVSIEWGFTDKAEPLNGNYTHAFLVTFTNKEAMEAYLPHPAHLAFKEVIQKRVKNVFVLDYAVVE
tara:strand:- start:1268 stop:1651 length:384 start_codon:yes stop_codon:yes gene_type:complete